MARQYIVGGSRPAVVNEQTKGQYTVATNVLNEQSGTNIQSAHVSFGAGGVFAPAIGRFAKFAANGNLSPAALLLKGRQFVLGGPLPSVISTFSSRQYVAADTVVNAQSGSSSASLDRYAHFSGDGTLAPYGSSIVGTSASASFTASAAFSPVWAIVVERGKQYIVGGSQPAVVGSYNNRQFVASDTVINNQSGAPSHTSFVRFGADGEFVPYPANVTIVVSATASFSGGGMFTPTSLISGKQQQYIIANLPFPAYVNESAGEREFKVSGSVYLDTNAPSAAPYVYATFNASGFVTAVSRSTGPVKASAHFAASGAFAATPAQITLIRANAKFSGVATLAPSTHKTVRSSTNFVALARFAPKIHSHATTGAGTLLAGVGGASGVASPIQLARFTASGSLSPVSITAAKALFSASSAFAPDGAGGAQTVASDAQFTGSGLLVPRAGGAEAHAAFANFSASGAFSPSGPFSAAFTLTNWKTGAGNTSPGFKRFGMPFAKGDVPAGATVQIYRGATLIAAQFDARTYWSDGSLKEAVCHIRDTTFGGGASFTGSISGSTLTTSGVTGTIYAGALLLGTGVSAKTYIVSQLTGSTWRLNTTYAHSVSATAMTSSGEQRGYTPHVIQNSSWNNTGTKSLSDITSTHQFKIAYTNVKTSAGATYGSGNFTLDVNYVLTQLKSGVATRVTKRHSGPVCEGWHVWGMATDNATSLEDAHLKGNVYIDIWKNADGSIADIEHGVVSAQDWWSVPNKWRLNYTATYQDGQSVIASYVNVGHIQQSWWLSCKASPTGTGDFNAGRRYWINAMPTIGYQPNRAYWVKSGLVGPYDYTSAENGSIVFGVSQWTVTTYTPCQGMNIADDLQKQGGVSQGQNGRGLIMDSDVWAFLSQQEQDVQIARISALSGLSVPYHFRSNDNRVRNQDVGVQDVANTPTSLLMTGGIVPNDNFSYTGADNTGMPPPVHAYVGTNATYSHNYAVPLDTTGRFGVFSDCNPPDTSHGAAYCYFMYLLEGEPYMLDAQIDLTEASVQGLLNHNGLSFGPVSLMWNAVPNYETQYNYPGSGTIPNTTFSACGTMNIPNNTRGTAWALNLLGIAASMCPDTDADGNITPEKAYLVTLNKQNTGYVALNMQYMPQGQRDTGYWIDNSSIGWGLTDHWHHHFICIGALQNATVTEDSNALAMGLQVSRLATGFYSASIYRVIFDYTLAYHSAAGADFATTASKGYWTPVTNDYFDPKNIPVFDFNDPMVSAATNTITLHYADMQHAGATMPIQNGDLIYPEGAQGGKTAAHVPQELVWGQPYVMTNVVNDTVNSQWTFQLQGVTFTQDYRQPNANGSASGTFATSGLSWSGGTVTATTSAPHGLTIGNVDTLQLKNAAPSGYNGTFECTVTSTTQFTYALASDPGTVTSVTSATWTNLDVSVTWSGGIATVTLDEPHNLTMGGLYKLQMFNVMPSGYLANPGGSGSLEMCTVTGPNTFTYTLASNPGTMTQSGSWQQIPLGFWWYGYGLGADKFPVAMYPPYLPGLDSYAPIARMALVMSTRAAGPNSPQAVALATADTFCSTIFAKNNTNVGYNQAFCWMVALPQ